jgi:hypothetical protein
MTLPPPPPSAAWVHQGAQSGFEVVFIQQHGAGSQLSGCTTAVEDEDPWIVSYDITVDNNWISQQATISARSSSGVREITLWTDGRGHWEVEGVATPDLDGCLDIDLESSVMTNALPIHRLGMNVHEKRSAPAAYVRASDLTVERLEQQYARLEDRDETMRYRYDAPVFDFSCELVIDRAGFVIEYPGIGLRVR